MQDEQLITFKEMCARFDVTPRTLRYYEYIELLGPRRVGRARFYGPREAARMTLILRGRRFGFSLEEIRQWLLIYEEKGSREQYETWVRMAEEKLKALDVQIEELRIVRKDLEDLRNNTLKTLEGIF